MQPPEITGDVTAKDIYCFAENMYANGFVRQLINLVVSGDVTISVYNDTDDVEEDVSREINTIFSAQECNITNIARSALYDNLLYGISIWNPIWSRNGTATLTCNQFIHLNPFTFAESPSMTNSRDCIYGRLLKGIYYNIKDDMIHYVQKQQDRYVELDPQNLFIIKDPASENPDGTSLVMSMGGTIKFLNYCWNSFGQQMFRTAAPIMFIRTKDPQPSYTDAEGRYVQGDTEYAQEILSTWGKDTGFTVRDNMDVQIIDTKEGSLAKVAIDSAVKAITEYVSPVGLLGRDSTLISGSSDASLRLINNYIKGWAKLLTNALRELPNYYLKYNGYPEGWHAEINIETVTIEDTDKKLAFAQLLSSTHAGSVNEVRELLGLEGVSADELIRMQSEWDAITTQQQQPAPMFSVNSEPIPNVRKKQSAISHKAEASIDDSTDDLLRGVLKIARQEAANRGRI